MEKGIYLFEVAARVAKNVSEALLEKLEDQPNGFLIMHKMFSDLLVSCLDEEVYQHKEGMNGEFGYYSPREMEEYLEKNLDHYLQVANEIIKDLSSL
jgi:hypothetical protein